MRRRGRYCCRSTLRLSLGERAPISDCPAAAPGLGLGRFDRQRSQQAGLDIPNLAHALEHSRQPQHVAEGRLGVESPRSRPLKGDYVDSGRLYTNWKYGGPKNSIYQIFFENLKNPNYYYNFTFKVVFNTIYRLFEFFILIIFKKIFSHVRCVGVGDMRLLGLVGTQVHTSRGTQYSVLLH